MQSANSLLAVKSLQNVGRMKYPVPDLIKIALQILLEHHQRLAVHPGSATVSSHQPPRFHHKVFGNTVWLCLSQELLPSRVDPGLRRAGPIPSLPPSYRASLLLRIGPPLRSASVLEPSRGLRSSHSLCIGAPGSHVPHESLCQARAAYLPVTVQPIDRLSLDLSQLPNRPGFDDG